MSTWTAERRRIEAEERRQHREVQKRQKELERRRKEHAKLSLLETARLEVDAYDNALDVLLSVHKEQSDPIEWERFATALSPHEPIKSRRHEFEAKLKLGPANIENLSEAEEGIVEEARNLDELEHQVALEEFTEKITEWKRMQSLAKRVLSGEQGAYAEAISEFSSLSEVAGLGSSLHVTVYTPKLVGCVLTVSNQEVVPSEVKLLTAAGKLSVKAMPKARFHEIYQDYVCGCVLRVAREMLALLPVDDVLVTASVNVINARSGTLAELPVISLLIGRTGIEQLDFERLDPSESMENFLHRGDVKASRKSGDFVSIEPLTPAEIVPSKTELMDFTGLLDRVRNLRAEISSKIKPESVAVDFSEHYST